MRLPTLHLVLTAVLLLGAGAPAPARAEGDCASARAANNLLGCEHCQALKKLFGQEAVSRLHLDIHEFDRGVLVEIHAGQPEDMSYVRDFVREMWLRKDHAERRLSDGCRSRYENLDRVHVEKVDTDDGVFLILTSEEPDIVRWMQDDAKSTRSYVLAAATN
jgi:hypothetical protein